MSKKTVIVNGVVHTVDASDSIAEALVLEGNRIVYVGSSEEAKKYIDSEANVIDAQGKSVVPGFIDSHIHAASAGTPQDLSVDASKENGVSCIDDILALIPPILAQVKKGEWVLGNGYNEKNLKEDRHPTRWELDRVTPDNPLMLTHTSGHVCVCNSLALKMAGVLDGSGNFPEECVIKDENGEPTGFLKESAAFMMMKIAAAEPAEEVLMNGISRLTGYLASLGITTVHDAGYSAASTFRILQKTREAGLLKCRFYVMMWSVYGKEAQIETIETQINSGFFTNFGDEMLKKGPLKIMIDGSSSAGTCATREPLSHNGQIMPPVFTQEEIDELVLKGHKAGFQWTAHAIGDRAIEMCLNAYEKAQKAYPRKDARHRIEHCSLCPSDLRKRIKELGVVPIPNPVFFTEWGQNYLAYYGERTEEMIPMRSFLDEGIICPIGSDAPTGPGFFNPLNSIAAAMDRMCFKNQTALGKKEAITLEEALRCMTYYGAYASFDENIKGSLEAGKLADVVILSDSLIGKSPEEIRSMHVEKTFMDGEIVYEA